MSYAPMVNDNLIKKLGDVSISSVSNGQVLKYNDTTDKWENGTVSGGPGGVSNLDDLGDVSITPAHTYTGQVLVGNGTNFTNRVLEESDIPLLSTSKISDGVNASLQNQLANKMPVGYFNYITSNTIPETDSILRYDRQSGQWKNDVKLGALENNIPRWGTTPDTITGLLYYSGDGKITVASSPNIGDIHPDSIMLPKWNGTNWVSAIADDIPELPQSKITGLSGALDAKFDKSSGIGDLTNVSLTPAHTYTGQVLVGNGTNFTNRVLEENDIPELPQSKITGLSGALDLKQDNITSATDLTCQNIAAQNLTLNGNLIASKLETKTSPYVNNAETKLIVMNDLNPVLEVKAFGTAHGANPNRVHIYNPSGELDIGTNTHSTNFFSNDVYVHNTLHTTNLNIIGKFNISDAILNTFTELDFFIVTLDVNHNSYATFSITNSIVNTLSTLTLKNLNTYGTQIILRIEPQSGSIILPADITINKTTTATSPTTTSLITRTDITSDVNITDNDACLVFIYVANANNVFLTHKLFN